MLYTFLTLSSKEARFRGNFSSVLISSLSNACLLRQSNLFSNSFDNFFNSENYYEFLDLVTMVVSLLNHYLFYLSDIVIHKEM